MAESSEGQVPRMTTRLTVEVADPRKLAAFVSAVADALELGIGDGQQPARSAFGLASYRTERVGGICRWCRRAIFWAERGDRDDAWVHAESGSMECETKAELADG